MTANRTENDNPPWVVSASWLPTHMSLWPDDGLLICSGWEWEPHPVPALDVDWPARLIEKYRRADAETANVFFHRFYPGLTRADAEAALRKVDVAVGVVHQYPHQRVLERIVDTTSPEVFSRWAAAHPGIYGGTPWEAAPGLVATGGAR